MKKFDLHSHTTASDGTLTPTELVDHAYEVGVSALAITDHDTTAGIDEAVARGAQRGVEIIPGVEISCRWGSDDIHIVGLNIDIEADVIKKRLHSQHQQRIERAKRIGDKLETLGHAAVYARAVELAQGNTPARPHFAQALVEQGVCKSMEKAFSKYLGTGKKAYVKTEWATLEEGVAAIVQAGGVAVIAHPGKYKMTRAKLTRLVSSFKEAGGQAIEVSTGTQTVDQLRCAAQLAQAYDLYASAGSDFHGPIGGWLKLGKYPPLPLQCKPVWTLFG